MKLIKIILIATLGMGILILIPDLMLPLIDLIDEIFTTELILVFDNLYTAIPDQLMDLLAMQFATLIIVLIIRWTIGN